MNINLIKYIFGGPDAANMNDPAIAEYEAKQLEKERQWYAKNIQEIEEALLAPVDSGHEAELRKQLARSQRELAGL